MHATDIAQCCFNAGGTIQKQVGCFNQTCYSLAIDTVCVK